MKLIKLFLLFTIILIIGCTSKVDIKDTNQDIAQTELVEETNVDTVIPEVIIGMEMEDVDDITTIDLGSELLDDGAIIDRKLEFIELEDGYKESLILEFSRDTVHIENIPKSLGETVADLEFSVEPDEIINDDPVVKWIVKMSEDKFQQIKIQATESITKDAFNEAKNALDNWQNPIAAAQEVKENGPAAYFLEHLEDFSTVKGIAKCSLMEDEIQGQKCVLGLIQKNPEFFNNEDCNKLDGFYFLQETWRAACRAMVNNDATKCFDILDSENYNSKYEKICKELFFDSRFNKCKKITDEIKRDECIEKAVDESGHMGGCENIKNEDRQKECMAFTNMNFIYCADIKTEQAQKKCCDKMGYLKDDCLKSLEESAPLEEIPEEIEASDDFRSRSSTCPYPVSNDAVWVEEGPKYMKTEGWKSQGKWVGEVTTYRNTEKTILANVICYKNGIKHGSEKAYDSEGRLLTDSSWVDGKAIGDWKTYWQSTGQLKSILTYTENGLDGESFGYWEDGSVQAKGTWKDNHQVGEHISYDRDGKPSLVTRYDNDGKQTYWKQY